ncbi:SAV_2336 N-terminal domain-related protein [Dactylosporangium sp. CA-233914]|uniref:SAV_2336 N-terminal domain-related protein n=1 Tax=Dactylosporangium sp. CA-233914 TaxID=3239934 RepID=UPI003D8DECEF
MDALVHALRAAAMSPDAVDLAEALWLAQHVDLPTRAVAAQPAQATTPPPADPPSNPVPAPSHATEPPTAPVYPRSTASEPFGGAAGAVGLRGPRVPALREALALGRALRPLRRTVPSRRFAEVDEQATADRVAQEGLWVPVLRPRPEPEADLVLIVDSSASMRVWTRTTQELLLLFQRLAAFRAIRTFTIDADGDLALQPRIHPAAVVDPTGHRLIVLVTDAVGAAWHDGRMDALLQRWGATNRLQIISVLPRRMWRSTGLRTAPSTAAPPRRIPVPVVELSLPAMRRRAHAFGEAPGAAILLPPTPSPTRPDPQQDPAELIRRFLSLASPTAQRLAGHLAAAPLTLPAMRLVQQAFLPRSDTTHLAEVFVSGLLERRAGTPAFGEPDTIEFEFRPGVRELLLDQADRFDAIEVLKTLTRFVTDRLGHPFDFPAMLLDPEHAPIPGLVAGTLPLARLTATVLRGLGPKYAILADRLESAAPRTGPVDVTPSLGYLAQVADRTGRMVGTCFQVEPGILATTWHVLRSAGADFAGAEVRVVPFTPSAEATGVVQVFDDELDLALLRCEPPLPASVPAEFGTVAVGLPVSTWSFPAAMFLTGRIANFGSSPRRIGVRLTPASLPGTAGAPVMATPGGELIGVVVAQSHATAGGEALIAMADDLAVLLARLGEPVAERPVAAPFTRVSQRVPSGEPPGQESPSPLFFVSYPRLSPFERGTRKYVQLRTFTMRLSDHLRELVDVPPDVELGYLDTAMRGGESWNAELAEAVGRCQVFIALVSRAYVDSAWCERELAAFGQRKVTPRDNAKALREVPIIPVVWSPLDMREVPSRIGRVQFFDPGIPPDAHRKNGLARLLEDGDPIADAILFRLAQRVQQMLASMHVEPHVLKDITDLQ